MASSTSPRSSASTTRASSRASHAPRASAACAYTWATAKAISREYSSTASRSAGSSPGAASSSTRSSMTAMDTRISSTVCCRETARAISRGAVPKTSVVMVSDRPGRRNQSRNAASPAWATRPTHERSAGGIARYHGSVSSIRWIAAVVSVPRLCSRRRAVAAWRRDMGEAYGPRLGLGCWTATTVAGPTLGGCEPRRDRTRSRRCAGSPTCSSGRLLRRTGCARSVRPQRCSSGWTTSSWASGWRRAP